MSALGAVFFLCLAIAGHSKPPAPPPPLVIAKTEASWGRSQAGATLIAYLDLQSSFSALAYARLKALKKHFGPVRLRIVYRHAPASFHVHAKRLALAAQAVHHLRGIEGFEAFVAAAFKERSGKKKLAPGADPIDSVVAQLGWAKGPILRAMRRPAIKQQVQTQAKAASNLRALGFTMFLNGLRLSKLDAKSLQQDVQAQLAKARSLRKKGLRADAIYGHLSRQQFKPTSKAKAPKKTPKVKSAPVWKLLDLKGSPARGARTPLVTMVVFSDLQCPFCERVDAVHKRLLKRYPKALRIVFKHYPLPFHTRAKAAHNFAMAAFQLRGDRGFWRAQEALLKQPRRLQDSDLIALSEQLGLPRQPVMAMVRAERFAKAIDKDIAQGSDFGVRGTPHQFINGRRLAGSRGEEDFARYIDEEILKARKLLKRGVPPSKLYATLLKDGLGPKEPPQKTIAAPTQRNPSRGPRNAKVVIQMFSDFQCPYCARVMPTLEKVLRTYPKTVRLVFRHRPLSFHRNAPAAHATALEAYRQAGNTGFWRMYQVLQANPRRLERTHLLNYARQQGLDAEQLRQAWQNNHHDSAIQADVRLADAAGISGTPAFVINNYYLAGAQPYSKFKRLVDKALKQKAP
jgi:protein-disulfide isomerase